VVGVDGDPAAFGAVYTMGEEKNPLLPRALTGGVIYDSLGSATFTDADGRAVPSASNTSRLRR